MNVLFNLYWRRGRLGDRPLHFGYFDRFHVTWEQNREIKVWVSLQPPNSRWISATRGLLPFKNKSKLKCLTFSFFSVWNMKHIILSLFCFHLIFSPFPFLFQWHALSREEQAKYYELARKERQLHMQLYPGWSARDNYVSTLCTPMALSSHSFSLCVALVKEMCCRVYLMLAPFSVFES